MLHRKLFYLRAISDTKEATVPIKRVNKLSRTGLLSKRVTNSLIRPRKPSASTSIRILKIRFTKSPLNRKKGNTFLTQIPTLIVIHNKKWIPLVLKSKIKIFFARLLVWSSQRLRKNWSYQNIRQAIFYKKMDGETNWRGFLVFRLQWKNQCKLARK